MNAEPETLRSLPLEAEHRKAGARMVPFVGWRMPLQYKGIVEETRAVRQHAGLFDVSHMGRLFVVGRDAAALLRRAATYNVWDLAEGRGHYALLCNDEGGILDDIFVYRLDEVRFLVVGNAANAEQDRDHIAGLVRPGIDTELLDRQATTVMLALQGPDAPAFFARVVGPHISESVPRHRCLEFELGGYKAFVSRTGYTGEDGFELVASVETGRSLWERLLALGVEPCGLGARDTLRLEVALPLYGQDIDATSNPWEAGLGWVVSLDDDADFVGRPALVSARERGVERRLVCLQAGERGVIRTGYDILHAGRKVGRVSSGGFSPTLGTSIAMAYLPLALTAEGTEVQVDVRGRPLPARVVPRPFYRRRKSAP
ncbi:MAG: glycine cleavage system aminomethyltransferase GcvT [Dehalococcoidia bacterium]